MERKWPLVIFFPFSLVFIVVFRLTSKKETSDQNEQSSREESVQFARVYCTSLQSQRWSSSRSARREKESRFWFRISWWKICDQENRHATEGSTTDCREKYEGSGATDRCVWRTGDTRLVCEHLVVTRSSIKNHRKFTREHRRSGTNPRSYQYDEQLIKIFMHYFWSAIENSISWNFTELHISHF